MVLDHPHCLIKLQLAAGASHAMKLSDLIRGNLEELAQEWEAFARTCSPAAASMNVERLRDHIIPLLTFVADDMDSAQSLGEQRAKSWGNQPRQGKATEAEKHAALRVIDGFTVDQVVAEFRALRASILRLWVKHQSAISLEPAQITRFNESIDQMLSESVARHAELEAEARDKSDRRDAFIATLSHELRNPLAAISNAIYLLEAQAGTNSELTPLTNMMARQTGHLKRLLDDLLDLARISRDRIILQLCATDIRECVQDGVDGNRNLIEQKAHVLTVDMPAEAVIAEVDCTRIVEIVSNLVNNAAKYSPPGSSIRVSLTRAEEHVMIVVQDNGLGLEPEVLPHIFEAFYANHEADNAKAGLGIGLWLTRSLVELHNGTISVNSEGLGSGAEFCVTIPLREQL
jgi:signal transduction histidine kinase